MRSTGYARYRYDEFHRLYVSRGGGPLTFVADGAAQPDIAATSGGFKVVSQDVTTGTPSQQIVGNAAANRLSGGLGNDTLDGAGGHDTFVFDTRLAADNVDVVKNFVAAEDTMELDARIFKGLPAGTLSAAAFGFGSAATSSSHRVLFDPVTKSLMYDADGMGREAAVPFAILEGLVGNLSAANLVVN